MNMQERAVGGGQEPSIQRGDIREGSQKLSCLNPASLVSPEEGKATVTRGSCSKGLEVNGDY